MPWSCREEHVYLTVDDPQIVTRIVKNYTWPSVPIDLLFCKIHLAFFHVCIFSTYILGRKLK